MSLVPCEPPSLLSVGLPLGSSPPSAAPKPQTPSRRELTLQGNFANDKEPKSHLQTDSVNDSSHSEQCTPVPHAHHLETSGQARDWCPSLQSPGPCWPPLPVPGVPTRPRGERGTPPWRPQTHLSQALTLPRNAGPSRGLRSLRRSLCAAACPSASRLPHGACLAVPVQTEVRRRPPCRTGKHAPLTSQDRNGAACVNERPPSTRLPCSVLPCVLQGVLPVQASLPSMYRPRKESWPPAPLPSSGTSQPTVPPCDSPILP